MQILLECISKSPKHKYRNKRCVIAFLTSNILIQASKEMVHRQSWLSEHFSVNFGIFHCHPNLGTIKPTFCSERQRDTNLLYLQTSSDKLEETDLRRTKREDSAKENQSLLDQKRCAMLLPSNPSIKSQRVHEAFGIRHLIQILMNDRTFRDERK
jgi:hypothetical protein